MVWPLKDVMQVNVIKRGSKLFLQVCFRCLASKGNDNFDTVFTNISADAAWRAHDPGPMWAVRPSASNLVGFSEKLISLDLLHICHLGILRDLVGTGFKLLARKKGEYYTGRNISKRLCQLFADLKRFCKDNKVALSLKRLRKATVGWRGDACPELKAKGADALACLRFLAFRLQLQPPAVYGDIVVCTWALEHFLRCLVEGNIFLSQAECATCYTVGMLFVKSYLRLANQSLQSGELYFKVRPKLHFMIHMVEDLKPKPGKEDWELTARNASFDATFVDEDFVKQVLSVKKRMSFRTASLHVLQRFCTVNKTALDAAKPL